MTHNFYIYLLVMSAITLAIRILPITIFRKEIKNKFVKSFLFYVPYITLAVMTFPAILQTTQAPWIGAIALIVGIICAWFGAGLFGVPVVCCVLVFLLENL